MTNRLLAYELRLFRNSCAQAFARTRDRALLAIMAALAVSWSIGLGSTRAAPVPAEAAWLAIFAMPVAFGWQRLVLGRLRWFSEESPLAAAALSRATAGSYLAAAHVLVLAPAAGSAVLVGTASGRPALAMILLFTAYATGLSLGSVRLPSRYSRERPSSEGAPAESRSIGGLTMLRTVLRSQTLRTRRPLTVAVGLVAANFALTASIAGFGRDLEAPLLTASILVPSLLTLLVTNRADAGLLGFLPFAGYGPLSVAFAVSAWATASLAAAVAAVAAVNLSALPVGAAALAVLHGGFIVRGIARAWLYPGRRPRSVDLQVQMELLGFVLIFIMLPPLAVVALPWRLAKLYRHHRSLIWAQP